MIRVLVAYPYIWRQDGGVETYIRESYRVLSKAGKIEPLYLGVDGQVAGPEARGRFVLLGESLRIRSTPIGLNWYRQLGALFDSLEPDLINGHLPVPGLADIAARVALKKRIPFVLTYHNDIVGDSFRSVAYSILYNAIVGKGSLSKSGSIVATSQEYAESSPLLRRHLHKIYIAPPGIREIFLDARPTVPFEDRSRTLLFVGRLDRESQYKGLMTLLRALAELRADHPDATLTVVGEGPMRDHYSNIASTLGVEEYVEFVGRVSDPELCEIYLDSKVLVLPSTSRAEGYGIVLREAQTCGVVTIGTAVGGIPSALDGGETGLLVPPNEPGALASAIRDVLGTSSGSRLLADRMRSDGGRRHSWEWTAARLLDAFEATLPN